MFFFPAIKFSLQYFAESICLCGKNASDAADLSTDQVGVARPSYETNRLGGKRINAYVPDEESDKDDEDLEVFQSPDASLQQRKRSWAEDENMPSVSDEDGGFAVDLEMEIARRKNSPASSSYEMQLRKLKQQVQRIRGTRRSQSRNQTPDATDEKENACGDNHVAQNTASTDPPSGSACGTKRWRDEAERSLALAEEMRQL
jgi:hypothetical protein